MSAFIYKVIVRGKVFGEATTLAEAEAAAKKHGGKVLQEMGKTSNPGAASGERVGDIILRQLGGTNRLKAMINANNFLIHPDGVEFSFSGPEPQKRGNNVLIRLEPGDTYSAGFIYMPKTSRHWATAIPSRPIHKYTGIYADQLMPLLERHTGLAWSLGSAFNSPKTSNPRASKLTPFAQAWFALMRTKPEGSYKIPLGDLREMQASYEDGDIDDRALWLMVPQPTVRAMLLPHQPPADLRRTGNPHEDEYIPVQHALSPFATAWFALMKAKGGREAAQARSLLPLYRDGTVNDRSLFLTTSGADLAKLPAPAAAMARPLAGRASNPPLEHSNAAILLDTVKPGKPQVIHGVKVSRVGAGYSIDRVVLSRELAIKRLEQGGKVGNPAMQLSHAPKVSIAAPEGTASGQRIAVAKFADPYVGNDFVNGLLFVVYDPQTLHVGGTQRIATAPGKDSPDYDGMFPDVAGLLRDSSGKINAYLVDGKTANPNAKPMAKTRNYGPTTGTVPPQLPANTDADFAAFATRVGKATRSKMMQAPLGFAYIADFGAFQDAVTFSKPTNSGPTLWVLEMWIEPTGAARRPFAYSISAIGRDSKSLREDPQNGVQLYSIIGALHDKIYSAGVVDKIALKVDKWSDQTEHPTPIGPDGFPVARAYQEHKPTNPQAKPAAKSKGGASDLDEYRKLEKQRSDAVIAAHRCGAYVRGSDGETVCPNSEAQSHMDRARRIGADLDRRFPALTGGRYSNPKAKTRKAGKPAGPVVYI